jgi:hypothetical protein
MDHGLSKILPGKNDAPLSVARVHKEGENIFKAAGIPRVSIHWK